MSTYFIRFLLAALLSVSCVHAQEKGSVNPQPLPPLAHPDDPMTPAKELFGRALTPASMEAGSIGFYSKGCLSGGQALPVNGAAWQVMRLSRNRNWGHPTLIAFLEKFANDVRRVSHWPGILVGDMSQPRGGPMITGHASHQIGLDVDVWLTPMPHYELSREKREEMSATDMVRPDLLDVDSRVWTPDHLAVIRAAAEDSNVQRIFVNAAIKKALCREAGSDRAWLTKVRPYFGHNYHFHIRLFCPQGEDNCSGQDEVAGGDGCDQLAYWFKPETLHPKQSHEPPKPPMTLSALPSACRVVLKSE